MGWLDAFTGKAAEEAAAAQMAQLQAAQTNATGALGAGFGAARGVLANSALPTVRSGYANALESLRGMYGQQQGFGGQATAAWNPLVQAGQQGTNAYLDATGAAGAAGQARARANFQTDPGYQFQMDQGLDAVNRTANSRGMLASGNNTTDLLTFSQGLANKSWGDYVSRLSPLLQMYGQGVAGQAGALTNQAGYAGTQGGREADTWTGRAQALGNLYGGIADTHARPALASADVYGRMGPMMGQAQAQGIMGQANAQGNTLMGGLNLLSKLAGGFA